MSRFERSFGVRPSSTSAGISIDASSLEVIDLDRAPAVPVIEVEHVGRDHAKVQLRLGSTVPAQIRMSLDPRLRAVSCSMSHTSPEILLTGSSPDQQVLIRGLNVELLAVEKVFVELETPLPRSVRRISLLNGGLRSRSPLQLDSLALTGTVTVQGDGLLRPAETWIGPGVHVRVRSETALGNVRMPRPYTPSTSWFEISGGFELSISRLPHRATVRLIRANLHIGSGLNQGQRDETNLLSFYGCGTVTVSSSVVAPLFIAEPLGSDQEDEDEDLTLAIDRDVEVRGMLAAISDHRQQSDPADEDALLLQRPDPRADLQLVVKSGGQVRDASGAAVLELEPYSFCSGSTLRPFRPYAIKRAEHAVIHAFSVYGLRAADLDRLAEAERLSIWIPEPRRAKRLEDAMLVGQPEPTSPVINDERAHFWTRLSTILSDKHASGQVQSEVRRAASRARRRIARGRERTLLNFYALVGYGERILLPFAWHFSISVVVAAILAASRAQTSHLSLDGPDVVAWLDTLLRTITSPLAFFRLVEAPRTQGLSQQLLLTAVRVVGLLMLFFSVAAARRIAKAE